MAAPELRVDVGLHVSAFRRLDRGRLLHMQRKMHPKCPYTQVDVFGHAWSVLFARLEPGAIHCRAGSEWVAVEGEVVLFLPPFSVVEWGLGTHPIEFHAFTCTEPMEEHWPKRASLYHAPWSETPKSFGDLRHWLETLKPVRLIERGKESSAVARLTKAEIDRRYHEPIPISAVAKSLGFAHAVMTRGFHQAYGLSPVQYRKKLRICESLHLLLTQNYSVASAALSVGFGDISRFNREFKRIKRTAPSSFRFKRSISSVPGVALPARDPL